MRFLTSFFAVQEDAEKILTGSERMKQRPIKPLVEALRELGADIEYLEKEGFPPLKSKRKKIRKKFRGNSCGYFFAVHHFAHSCWRKIEKRLDHKTF